MKLVDSRRPRRTAVHRSTAAFTKSIDLWGMLLLMSLLLSSSYFLSVNLQTADARIIALTELQQKQSDIFIEMNKLLTTLATATFGGLFAYITGIRPNRRHQASF
jgi:hypothetical protein